MKKNLFIIGHQFTKSTFMMYLTASLFFGTIAGSFISQFIDINFILLGSILSILCALIYIPLMTQLEPHWLINDETLLYFYPCDYIEKLKYAFTVFNNNFDDFAVKISLSQIQSIHITWTLSFGWAQSRFYPLKISIKTLDGTIMTMKLDNYKKEEFIKAFDYLKLHNIEICDKYNLISAINNPDVNLHDYISDIEYKLSRGAANEN